VCPRPRDDVRCGEGRADSPDGAHLQLHVVCDAQCEMCNNWKHGDRKSDMTLAQLEPVMSHAFWGAIENLNISAGTTTRNDLPEMVETFQRHLPRMRKIGINTTGLTPHRAIPMLTRIVKFCALHDLLVSVRSPWTDRRRARPGPPREARVREGLRDIEAMQALSQEYRTSSSASRDDLRDQPRRCAEHLAWARSRKSTSCSTCCVSPTPC